MLCVWGLSRVRLCDPMGYSLTGSSLHGFLQERILGQAAIFPPPRDLPNAGTDTVSPVLALRFFTTEQDLILFHTLHSHSHYASTKTKPLCFFFFPFFCHLNSKAFNLRRACLVPGPHPRSSRVATAMPATPRLPSWVSQATPLQQTPRPLPPSLRGRGRWGGHQSPGRPQHQHGQGPGPRRVDLLVPVQVGTLAEALAAQRAGVGPDAAVDVLVGGEVRAVAEALAAVQAVVGLLAGVRAVVRNEAGSLAEALTALGAGVGLTPVWVRWWVTSAELCVKHLPQMRHLSGLVPVWVPWWVTRSERRVKRLA